MPDFRLDQPRRLSSVLRALIVVPIASPQTRALGTGVLSARTARPLGLRSTYFALG